MKTLIIKRHGYADASGKLTEEGISVTEEFGREVGELYGGRSVAIYTSSIPRARCTAEIIGQQVGIESPPLELKLLHEDAFRDISLAGIASFFSDSANVALCVTHRPNLGNLFIELQGNDAAEEACSFSKGGGDILKNEYEVFVYNFPSGEWCPR